MGTRTQQQMMVPPPEARPVPTGQSFLSESDPVSETEPLSPNRNDQALDQARQFTDRFQRQLIRDLESSDPAKREAAQRQLQSMDAFDAIFAGVRTGKISHSEFMKLSDALRRRGPSE